MAVTVSGTSAKGKQQQIECWLDENGQLAMWVHRPNSGSGAEIHVSPIQFFEAIIRVCIPQDQASTREASVSASD